MLSCIQDWNSQTIESNNTTWFHVCQDWDDTGEDEITEPTDNSKFRFEDIFADDARFGRKSRRPTFDDDGCGLPPVTTPMTGGPNDDAFDLPVSEFLGGPVGGARRGGAPGGDAGGQPRFDTKDLLSQSLRELPMTFFGLLYDMTDKHNAGEKQDNHPKILKLNYINK